MIPEGAITTQQESSGQVPCDIEVRYDNGIDTNPGSSPTLGYFAGDDRHQFLGVRFTAPAGAAEYEVQSASWFSDFWVIPGLVDVTVYAVANPSNTTTTSINVTAAGDWNLAFESPICIPAGEDCIVMLCPQFGVFGVLGEDFTSPDGRSTFNPGPCETGTFTTGNDYLLASCVTECGPTPVEETSWGKVKTVYRWILNLEEFRETPKRFEESSWVDPWEGFFVGPIEGTGVKLSAPQSAGTIG